MKLIEKFKKGYHDFGEWNWYETSSICHIPNVFAMIPYIHIQIHLDIALIHTHTYKYCIHITSSNQLVVFLTLQNNFWPNSWRSSVKATHKRMGAAPHYLSFHYHMHPPKTSRLFFSYQIAIVRHVLVQAPKCAN